MPDTTATDPVDAELRRIAEALVADAPEAPSPVDVDESVLAADAGLEAAPQRLFLDDFHRELLRDGEIVELGQAGLRPHGARPLADGGHVVVGVHPLEEPPPDGFNEMTDMTYGLAVVDADGMVAIERDIEPSLLVGVTATEAILVRQPSDENGDAEGPASVVTHDLATGEEQLIRRSTTFDPERSTSSQSAVVAGDLVTIEATELIEPTGESSGRIVPGSGECTLRVTDRATGDQAQRPLELPCRMLLGMQASPDGSRVAVAYETSIDPADPERSLLEVRLAVIDLPGGAVHHDELLGHNLDCRPGNHCRPGAQPVDFRGMAWDDDATLRLATDDLSDTFDEVNVASLALD